MDLATTIGPTDGPDPGHITEAGTPREGIATLAKDLPAHLNPGLEWLATPLAEETTETITGPCLALSMAAGHVPTLQLDTP